MVFLAAAFTLRFMPYFLAAIVFFEHFHFHAATCHLRHFQPPCRRLIAADSSFRCHASSFSSMPFHASSILQRRHAIRRLLSLFSQRFYAAAGSASPEFCRDAVRDYSAPRPDAAPFFMPPLPMAGDADTSITPLPAPPLFFEGFADIFFADYATPFQAAITPDIFSFIFSSISLFPDCLRCPILLDKVSFDAADDVSVDDAAPFAAHASMTPPPPPPRRIRYAARYADTRHAVRRWRHVRLRCWRRLTAMATRCLCCHAAA